MNIYGVGDGKIYSLDKSNGDLLWSSKISSKHLTTLAVNDSYVVSFDDGVVNVYDTESGDNLYSIDDRAFFDDSYDPTVNTAPMLWDEKTAVIIYKGYLSIYDLENKKVLKHFGPGFSGTPAADDNMLYAPIDKGIVAISKDKYLRQWIWKKANEVVSGDLVLTRNLLFVSTDKNTYAIDIKSKKDVWNYHAFGKLAVAKNHLFISHAHYSSSDLNAIKLQ